MKLIGGHPIVRKSKSPIVAAFGVRVVMRILSANMESARIADIKNIPINTKQRRDVKDER